MPTFEYIAKDPAGKTQQGLIQADSEAAVVRTLDQRSLFPVRIVAQDGPAKKGGLSRWSVGSRRVKLRQLAAAYGQLADLLGAGVPLLRGLDIIGRTSARTALGKVMDSVREGVAGGATLADSMARHPKVFKSLHVAMVHAGEHAGFLEQVLINLSGFLDRQDDLRGRVRGAMIYPVVLAVFGAVVVTLLLIFLVPQFKQFLANVPLPLPSRILFLLSDMMLEHIVPFLAVTGAVVGTAIAYIRSDAGQQRWDRWKLKVPLVGHVIRMIAITRFCRILGTLLANGVPIIQALNIAKDATGNQVLAEAVEHAAENVRAGEPLAEPLGSSGLFPAEIVEMIAVGEESNQLEKVLVQTADALERRTNRQVDAAVRLVEPIMLMIMAVAVGFIAVGLLYPIFTLAKTMR